MHYYKLALIFSSKNCFIHGDWIVLLACGKVYLELKNYCHKLVKSLSLREILNFYFASSPLFYFQVVDDDQGKCMNNLEDTKFYVLKAEWFWTRIAEGKQFAFLWQLILMRIYAAFFCTSRILIYMTCSCCKNALCSFSNYSFSLTFLLLFYFHFRIHRICTWRWFSV